MIAATWLSIYLLSSCGAVKPYIDRSFTDWQQSLPPDSSLIQHTVYLVGDAGAASTDKQEPSLKLLQTFLQNGPMADSSGFGKKEDIVIFLGDNIYHHGLPEVGASDREEAERKIVAQLDVVKNYRGKKYFIPGNHDWNASHRGGLQAVNRQEAFVEQYLNGENAFRPSNGCSGPIDVIQSHDLVIFFIDSEWWLHRYEKPYAPENGCRTESDLDFMVQLEDLLNRYKGKNILITQHHPLYSNGNHGGHYSLKDHIFPLTLVREKLYIPIPVLGSIYPLGRMYGTTRQDIPHPKYQQLIQGMMNLIEDNDYVILAAGHEHNLQHWRVGNFTQIVSGSGCKDKYLVKGNGATFAYDHKGFSILKYYTNGEAWVEYWVPVEDGSTGEMVFRVPAYARKSPSATANDTIIEPNYTDSTIVLPAGDEYAGLKMKNIFWGKHYRDAWEVPVEMPYLSLSTFAGGIKPLQMGGGKQTISLRTLGEDGNQYTIRSVNKNPSSALPENLQQTFAEEILQDQISSAHPYGALTIPSMAEPLGILHATPQLVYVPHSPLLGNYLTDFGGMVAMIEVRPEDDMGCLRGLGCLESVISSRTMFRKLLDDNDNEVDVRLYLKSRLFDMLVGDWDRHEDQWRWAEKPKEGDKGRVFLPIPRDRDQVYVKLDGVLPKLGSAKWAVRHLSHFGSDFQDIVGLNISATGLDRTILNEAGIDLWMELVDTLQAVLTDSVIEYAIRQLPPEAFAVSGQEIIDKLKSRRGHLREAAAEYYDVLAERVDVLGSEKHEFVLIERLDDDFTRIQMWKKKKEGELLKPIYDRTFNRKETDEINVFTQGGMDSVIVRGDVKKGILIRIITGEGEDYILDSSRVRGMKNKTVFIEQPQNESNLFPSNETRLKISEEEFMHSYNRNDFRYDFLGPRLYIEYNVDDGLYLGAGVLNRLHGFKKDPYKVSQFFRANYATRTGAYNFRYDGRFYSFFRPKVDLILKSHVLGPSYQMNYFGENNSDIFSQPIDYYRVRMNKVEVLARIDKRFTEFFRMGIGPLFEQYTLKATEGRFVTAENFPFPSEVGKTDRFVGATFNMDINFTDNEDAPTRGIHLQNLIDVKSEMTDDYQTFSRLASTLEFYFTPNFPMRMTFATRLGLASNFGDYNFYQGNFLGGFSNLRGYHRTRFVGRSTFFNNNELRWRTFNFRNYVFTGTGGLMGFVDFGRVWEETISGGSWHTGYGPGAWINFYDYFLVSTYLGFSKEGRYLNVNFGYFF